MVLDVAIVGLEDKIGSSCQVRVEGILFHVFFAAYCTISHDYSVDFQLRGSTAVCGYDVLLDSLVADRVWMVGGFF